MADIALSLKQIIKDFPGVRALDKASLALRTGEVHGLVGENGAGKSTIIKILAGVYSADEGGVEIFGRTLQHVTPKSVHDAGSQVHSPRAPSCSTFHCDRIGFSWGRSREA